MKCKYCEGKIIRRGTWGKKFNGKIKHQCKKCGKYQPVLSRHTRTAKILLLDIETLYMEVKGIWNLKHNDYIQPDRITKDWSILCWAAKWLFESKIMGQVVKPQEGVDRTEASIIEGIWKLLDQADIVVMQNGKKFDVPKLNSKFIKHGFPPPSPYQVVDTLLAMRAKIYLPSYKLDYVAKHVLGIEGKIKTGIEDWDRCNEGDKEALKNMLTYCKKDVAPLLEDLYLTLLPWIPGHPNLGIYVDHDKDVCPKCESQDLSWSLEYPTPQGLWNGFRCNTCGATGRGTSKDHAVKKVSIKAT